MHLITLKRACQIVFAIALLCSNQLYAQTNLALNKTTTASSAVTSASFAVDGNASSRWESTHGVENSWLQIDLGAVYALTNITIDWEAANAANYEVLGSFDGTGWSPLASRTGGAFGGRSDSLTLSGSYRYVKINATKRSVGNTWGYSIWEVKVSGSAAPQSTNVAIGKLTTASSAFQAATDATDGSTSTRWESVHSAATAWVQIDLGATYAIVDTSIDWEAANAANYDLQGSLDGTTWAPIASRTGGFFGKRTDTYSVAASHRYLRLNATKKSVGNNWGYSIWEWKVNGTLVTNPGSTSSSKSSSTTTSSSSSSSTSSSSSSKSSLSSSSSSLPPSSTSSSSSSAVITTSSSSSTSSFDRNNYNAPRATTAPVIDGQADAIWDTAPWAPIDVFWFGSQNPTAQDFSGRYKALWDSGNVYLLVDITDDVLFDATANPLERYWDDDSVEIFLDENKSGGNHQSSVNAWAYHVGINGDNVDSTNSTSVKLLNDHITVRRVSLGSKHMWEMSVRVYGDNYVDNANNTPVTLTLNKLMGFSVCYNDNDASSFRESMVGSVDTAGHKADQGYVNASVFGSMRLVEATTK